MNKQLNTDEKFDIGMEIINGLSTVTMSMNDYGLTRGQVRYAVQYAAKCMGGK